MNRQRTTIWMVATSVVLMTGCSFASDKSTNGLDYLPEPSSDRPFLTGWQSSEEHKSARAAHAELEAQYIKAATTAASDMGWELEKLLVTNPSNVSTTTDPAEFRSTTLYGVQAPSIGCEVETRDNGRTITNCRIKVITGGLKATQPPVGMDAPKGNTWGFDQGMNHTITLERDQAADLTKTGFAKQVSVNLPGAVFLYTPANGGHWFHHGKRMPE